jgi:hypothetical protein
MYGYHAEAETSDSVNYIGVAQHRDERQEIQHYQELQVTKIFFHGTFFHPHQDFVTLISLTKPILSPQGRGDKKPVSNS